MHILCIIIIVILYIYIYIYIYKQNKMFREDSKRFYKELEKKTIQI